MKITIITTTYNRASTLRETLESVLAQSYPNYEHIIVDGMSSDRTMDIVREYEPRYNGKLRYIREKDGGIYDAMNKGLKIASGDVVGFLNSDDYYTTNDILQTIADTFARNPQAEAIYGDVHYIDASTNRFARYYSSAIFRPWMMRMGFMPAHPSFYCKRETYEKTQIYYSLNYKIAADFEWMLRLIYKQKIRTTYIRKDFVTMRTGGASSSGIACHQQINRDHLCALRVNHVYSNILLLGIRYVYKIGEIIISRIFRKALLK